MPSALNSYHSLKPLDLDALNPVPQTPTSTTATPPSSQKLGAAGDLQKLGADTQVAAETPSAIVPAAPKRLHDGSQKPGPDASKKPPPVPAASHKPAPLGDDAAKTNPEVT